MHWVNRGPEPARLAPIRARQTPPWVRYYVDEQGDLPTYHGWRSFRDELELAFQGLCAYCEQFDPGEVEHFRPKSVFPHDVYVWANWLFACHACNQAKGEKWPDVGYVDPCAAGNTERPEHYFYFAIRSGRIIERPGLSCLEKCKAQRMIKDLKLNEWYQVEERKKWIDVLEVLPESLPTALLTKVQHIARRSAPLSSITRVWLTERGYPVGMC